MFEARKYFNTHEIIWNRTSFGDFRFENKFLAGVPSLEFLVLLFQDKRIRKKGI